MFALVLLAALSGSEKPVLVLEARLQDEQGTELPGQIAAAVGVSPSSSFASALSRRLPKVVAGTGKTEVVIEADRLVEQGRDAFLEGRFTEATAALTHARDLLSGAIESFDEERKAAESYFREQMYLALALNRQGGIQASQAIEILKETIRTWPQGEPSYSEYGPEPVRLYSKVKNEMDGGPMGRLRVQTAHEGVGIYLNGRLIGVTPVDVSRVYPGHYRLHARRGSELSRIHEIDIKPGDNNIRIDVDFDVSLRTDGDVALAYSNPAQRRARFRHHAVELMKLLDAGGAFVVWREGTRVHLSFVDDEGNTREVETDIIDAARTAPDLRAGRVGTFVKGDAVRPRRVWTWVAGGIAVGALATGVVLGLSANSDFDTLKQRYPTGDIDPKDIDLRDSAQTKQTTANVLVGVGAAAAIGTALLYWYEGKPPESEWAQIAPVVTPSFAGAQVRIAF